MLFHTTNFVICAAQSVVATCYARMGSVGEVIRCQAAVAWEVNKPMVIEEIEVAPPKEGEVRIKILASGICLTDVHTLQGYRLGDVFPCVLGHEGAGVVESVGLGVTSVAKGDHVIPFSVAQCNKCPPCKSPKTNVCLKTPRKLGRLMSDGTSRLTCKGKSLYHFVGMSTFSQYTVVHDYEVVKISEDAPLEKVCLIGCGIITGYGAAINTAKVEPGSTCAIWGLGTVGLAAAMGCRERGAARIIGIDVNPAKFEIAPQFGVTECVNPNDHEEPIEQVIKKLTKLGCDYTFECIGNVSTMQEALESLHMLGATCVVVGMAKYGEKISVSADQLLSGKVLTGSILGGWKCMDSIPKLVDKYMNKELMIDEFITHNISLAEINESFDMMKEGKSLRTVISLF